MINFISFHLFLFSKFSALTGITSVVIFFRVDFSQNKIEFYHPFIHPGSSLTFCTQLGSEVGSGEGTGRGGLEGFVMVAMGMLVEQGQVC